MSQVIIKLLVVLAATMELIPLLSMSGESSTISQPIILNVFNNPIIFSKSCQKNPPGSGVPVPGSKLGSNQSKSTVK